MSAYDPNLNALFSDLYASAGWNPGRHRLEELLVNATSAGGSWDPASLAAALLEAVGPAGGYDGGYSGGYGRHHAPAPAPAPGGGDDPSGPIEIGWIGMALAVLLILVNGIISVWLSLGLSYKLAIATVRCIVQLSLLGYILVPIFTTNKWWLTALYTLFMLTVAAMEAVSRPAQSYPGMLPQVFMALGVAGSAVISYGLALVVQVHPWWAPQYLIPMLGMLLGNACSGVAVGLSTVLDELSTGRDKVEFLLAMGGTRMEATNDLLQRATRMALTPLLNQMNVVGIVSIPGMMTGQILGGSNPSVAARYQIIVMFLISAATATASVTTIFLAIMTLVDDCHRLRSERMTARPTSAKGALNWLVAQLGQGWKSVGQLGGRTKRAFNGAPERKPSERAHGDAQRAGYQQLPPSAEEDGRTDVRR